jgi:hypothetical protein
VVIKKNAKLWVTVYPISSRPDLPDVIESGLLDFSFGPKLGWKRVLLNKLLDFDAKKYL